MKENWRLGKIKPHSNSINESKEEVKLRKEISKLTKLKVEKKPILYDNNKWLLPDIIIDDKIIIEYYGDFWHANPQKYSINEEIKFPGKNNIKLVKDIWNHDKKRINILEQLGYKIYVVWQNDYKNKKIEILNKLKNILIEYEKQKI